MCWKIALENGPIVETLIKISKVLPGAKMARHILYRK